MNDDTSDHRDPRPADEPATGRRAVWSRRIAVAVLVTFAAFVLFNVAVVLALLLAAARGGGGPFN